MAGKRGFASMDKELVRQIASKGGKAAHAMGVAHEYNSETGKVAGRKGGKVPSSLRHKFTSEEASAAGKKGGNARKKA